MKNKIYISTLLVILLISSMFLTASISVSATSSLSYSFENNNKGNARGTISLTANAGTYELYWADNTSALQDFQNITTFQFTSSGTKSYTMPLQTAIPENATKLIAVKSNNTARTVYFINNIGWDNVYCHAYEKSNTSNKNAPWPGVKMDYVTTNSDGNKVYSIKLDNSFDEMQFDNGDSGNKNQTVDIPIGTKNAYTISDTNSTSKYNINNITYGSESVPYLVSDAVAVYIIPTQKIITGQKLYSFASYSDIQLDNSGSSYPYSTINLQNALSFANDKSTDFIITAGDNVNNSNTSIQEQEWAKYKDILSNSSYKNPVYEAVGNHELWSGVSTGTSMFIKNTGLDDSQNAQNSTKAYYEITKNGDHFIFMALEGGFYPDRVEEFSDAQLDWVENLIKKYSGDGHNIFVIEHSPFKGYGAGDNITNPLYDIPLNDTQSSSKRLKSIFEQNKEVIFISGHTHIELSQQYNYSDNNKSSCQMIHNSSVGGSRTVVNSALNHTYTPSRTEGYIVDVYSDMIIFKGANLYYEKYLPNCTYLVNTSSSYTPQQPTTPPTTNPTFDCGDTNNDGIIDVKDATAVQLYSANLQTLSQTQLKSADVNSDNEIDIRDASIIQQYVAGLIKSLPI